jgi:hypothetical protein
LVYEEREEGVGSVRGGIRVEMEANSWIGMMNIGLAMG